MRIEDLLEFEGLTADQMRRLRELWAAGRSVGEIKQELGLSGALVMWAIWVRHLPRLGVPARARIDTGGSEMSDTEKLIEAAERWAKNVSESPGNGTAGEDLYGARLLISLAAALRETTAREEKQKRQFDEALGNLMDGHAEEIRKRGLSNAVTAETYDACHAALRQTEEERDRERKRADVLAAANVAANKRIEALEHERDAARAALARLTTPRPIAEAPKDGTWVVIHWSKESHPVFRSLRWRIARYVSDCFVWADERQEPLLEPSHFLPLPEVKP